ncbi:peptide/nickel transport system substrate-binding protein [Proteiniborus ethanoligenes]|uniref:Peptide/nickel transport system substrate-binding protein n=1 Tax=Proteiniborus ethanoligenes TaxID=415015 RepID=A0A1H3MMS4_9FIRM|nr:ABC transporter substrate-binding protein [Proteiniborus ethanoligenes]SDY77738.1 peptide/nickel transport system substrate-binding protein [Proteiniborus ethanoligenes]
MMKKSIIFLLVLTLAFSAFLVGCTPKEQPVDQPKNDQPADTGEKTEDPVVVEEPSGTLVVGITEASGNFNPLYYSSAYDGYVVDMVFEGLIARNFDGEYEGVLAESWEYSNNDTTITFKMRQDKKFSDGTPVTAHDIVFAYQVLADPSYTGRYGAAVKDMKGYTDYVEGKTEVFEGAKALDDYTVEFNFELPLRTNFANCGYPAMPRHHYGKDFAYNNTAGVEAITGDVMGSGPYKVELFQEKEFVSLTRNENYVGEGYLIKDIILKFVDQTTDIVELTTGEVDLLAGMIEPDKINQAKNAGKQFNSYPRSGYGYVKLNCEWGPTADPKVRQALYYAFNREEFVNSYFKDEETGIVIAGTQAHPFSQISWALDDKIKAELNNYDFDLEKAKTLLEEAGWKLNSQGFREKDGKVMEMNIAAMPDHDILATLIPMWERDWGKGLGVKLNIAYLEFNTILDYVIYNSDANYDKWSLFFLATSINSPDPHTLYSSFHSDYVGSGKDNTSRYKNPKVDELLDKGKTIMDIEEAKPVYQEVVKILNEEAVMMPVYVNTYFDLYDAKLTNFTTSSLYNWVAALKDAKVAE